MMEISEKIKFAKQQLKSGQLKLAEETSKQILRTDAGQPEALHLLGIIYHKTNKSDIAADLITKAIAINFHVPEYHYNLGIIFSTLGKTEDAIRSYRASLSLKPDYPDALNNLGLILYEQNRLEESIVLFQQAIRNKPGFTKAYYNLGNALQAKGDPRAAIEAYNLVLKMLPDSAETRFNRSLSLLLTENFEEGWVEYEWRFRNLKEQTKKWNEKGVHRWDGASLDGKRLLVLDEQGIGDTLQFIRYLPMVKELGGTVIFETIPSLIRLLRNFQAIDELLDRSSVEISESAFDLYIPLMSLPGIFNTTLEMIPDKVPYIFPDTTKAQYWQRQLKKGGFNIGIVWAGKSTDQYDSVETSGLENFDLKWAGTPASKIAGSRSNRLEYFAPLAQIPGVRLFGLQKGAAATQTKEVSQMMNVINLGEKFIDFSDTAAVIANLDLVISVDTSVAHLSGAMGKPVWVLLPFVPDWRWMLEREDSPWYPSMRLFRQQKKGDWDEVFQRVAAELHVLIDQ